MPKIRFTLVALLFMVMMASPTVQAMPITYTDALTGPAEEPVSPTAQAVPTTYTATLTGPAEEPPNASPGTGSAQVMLDTDAHALYVDMTFADLLGPTTVAHIHGPTPAPGTGVAGAITQVPSFVGFPMGVTSGTYSNVFDTTQPSTYNPAFIAMSGGTVAAAEAAMAASLAAGTAYVNIHSTLYPEGEIRGFLQAQAPAPVPEPATLMLFATGLYGLIMYRRKQAR